MKKSNTLYEKLWAEEYSAHMVTIKKNTELKHSVDRLIKINDNLIKKLEVYALDFKVCLDEIVRLKALNEALTEQVKNKEDND